MSDLRKNLFGSAAAFAVLVAAPSAAFAFDEVDWVWHKKVDEHVDIDIDIKAEIDPTGLTQVEKLQIQIGDVTADSRVHDIDNNQPAEAGGVATVDEVFTFTGNYDGPPPSNVVGAPIAGAGGVDLDAEITGGTIDENMEAFEFEVAVTGEVTVDPADSFDAEIELPTVESTATAVGNNQAINSDVATMLHDGQFLFDVKEDDGGDDDFGGFGPEDAVGALGALALGSAFADNSHTALAVGASVLAITGTIEKANIDSTSEVYNILNARVDSAATSVGNNISVNVNPDGDPTGDSVLIADITQFGLADITAQSDVYNVSVNNYHNLAAVNPLVSSAATAVGNNVSINVGKIGE